MNEAKEKSNNKKELINNLLTRIKERKWFLLAILIAWIILIVYVNPDYYESSKYVTGDDFKTTDLRLTKEFEQDEERRFSVAAEIDNLEQISIYGGTFGNYSESILNIKILEKESNKTIFDENIDTSDIYVQEYIDCVFTPQENSKGKEYEVVVKCVERKDNTLFFWDKEIINENGIKENVPAIKLVYINSQVMILYGVILIALLFVMIILFLFVEPKLNEKNFIIFASVIGLCFLILSPFPHRIDEYSHYLKSYIIANGKLYNDINSDGRIGAFVSENYEDVSANTNSVSLKTLFMNENIRNFKYSDNKDFHENFYLSSTIPIDHSIASIGILIAKIFDMNIVGYIILARGVTLAAYITISYFAIKNMKYYKSTMFVILTLPVGLWMAGTVSVDPILHGAAFLFTSICLKYFFDDNIENKVTSIDKILIILTAICIISTKYLVYTPLILLFFLIPKEKFNSKSEYIQIISMSIMIGILIIIWQFWMLGTFKYDEDRSGGDTGIEGQISFILDNFMYFIRIYIKSFESVWVGQKDLTSFFGPVTIPSCFMLISALEKEKYEFKGKKKSALYLLVFVVIAIVALILLAEYLAWNPIGNDEITGYQGRYIIPVLLLWGILIGNIIKVENKVGNYELMIALFVIVTNLNVIFGNIMTMFE